MVKQETWATKKRIEYEKKSIRLERELERVTKEKDTTIKSQDDIINTQLSYIHDLEQKLNEREEQDSLIICKNGDYITSIVKTSAYNERVALQEISGINLLTITQTPLYQKFPFLYEEQGQLKIDKKIYNKYLGGLI